MPNCTNCSKSNAKYCLCSNCYNNIFKSLYCDGHCGRKCDPSQRTGSNIIALPWWWYCETCRKKRENPNLPPDTKRVMTEDEIERLQKKLKELEEKNKEFFEKNQNLENQKRNLEKEKEKLKEQTIGFSGQYHEDRTKLEKYYDVIVDIDSLKHITKGWDIKMSDIGKKNYELMKDEEVLIVGVVGNRNRGKSFVLSKLSGDILPDGTSIKTEGISIKYPKMKEGKPSDYILMDSAGFENALLENDEFKNDPNISKEDAKKKLKSIASDKTLTEYFIQNFIIQKSNILVLVIGILNYPEQKLLNRIKTENENKFPNATPPPFFVIHNLQTFSLKKQVEDYIEETLLKSATFKLEKKKSVERFQNSDKEINNIYFIEKFNDKKEQQTKIYHLILAMHGTEAGEYYNEFTYNFLSKQFDTFPIHENFPIIQEVKNQLIESSNNLMEKPIKSIDEFEKTGEGEKKKIKLKEQKDENGKDIELKFKRCLIDELGFSNFYGNYFEPKYSYFKTFLEKKPYICIELEIPGFHKMKKLEADMFGDNWIVEIQGKKIKDNIDESKKDNIENENNEKNNPRINEVGKREYGEFNFNIKLKAEEFPLASKKPDRKKTIKKDGLLSYFIPLADEGNDEEDEPL